MDKWACVVITTYVETLDGSWIYCYTGCILGKALRTKESLPDFCENMDVTPKNRGGGGLSLTTLQPVEYSWMSGYPTPLTKIEQSLLCTGSSTQGTTCPNN